MFHSHCNIALQTCRLCSCISDWARKSNSKFTTEFFSTHVHIWSSGAVMDSWSILNISNNSWPIWPWDMKEKTRLWSHDLFTISPQQHLLKHNTCTYTVSMRLTRYIIDSSLRVRACIRITNSTTLHMKYCLLSWLFIRTIESERALAAQKVHVQVHLYLRVRVRLHCEFCVFCFVTVKSALFARNYHIFGMLFIPKMIIIFNFYLVIFGVLYVVKLKLALEIFACPIRASIFCRCSKMLARFQLLLAPGNRASAYVAPCGRVFIILQQCSVENQKTFYSDSALLVLNETSLNNDNARLALNWRYTYMYM